MDDHARTGQNGAEKPTEPTPSGAAADVSTGDAEEGNDQRVGAESGRSSEKPADTINAVRGLVEQVLEEGLSRVKGEGGKLGNRASQTVSSMLTEFGVAQRRDHEDLELRIAQLEHRVRLLEGQQDAGGEPASLDRSAPADAPGAADTSSDDAS